MTRTAFAFFEGLERVAIVTALKCVEATCWVSWEGGRHFRKGNTRIEDKERGDDLHDEKFCLWNRYVCRVGDAWEWFIFILGTGPLFMLRLPILVLRLGYGKDFGLEVIIPKVQLSPLPHNPLSPSLGRFFDNNSMR